MQSSASHPPTNGKERSHKLNSNLRLDFGQQVRPTVYGPNRGDPSSVEMAGSRTRAQRRVPEVRSDTCGADALVRAGPCSGFRPARADEGVGLSPGEAPTVRVIERMSGDTTLAPFMQKVRTSAYRLLFGAVTAVGAGPGASGEKLLPIRQNDGAAVADILSVLGAEAGDIDLGPFRNGVLLPAQAE